MENLKLGADIFEPFANDLWNERRLRLQDVLDHIEKQRKQMSDIQQDGPQLEQFQAIINDWIKFVKFLAKNCSGIGFENDKQWSELMNLMQISRKLNHRSVRFKDIIKQRIAIESNASNIQQLNKTVKLCATIETYLDELESLLKSCRISLTSLDESDEAKQDYGNKFAPLESTEEDLELIKSQLEERFRATLYTLKLEINENSVVRNARNEIWRLKLDKLEISFETICLFLSNLNKLRIKLSQLEPFSRVVMNKDENHEQRALGEFDKSISTCWRKVNESKEFYESLKNSLRAFRVTSARQTAKPSGDSKTKKRNDNNEHFVPLAKLLNPKTNLFVNEIFGSSLTRTCENLDECCSILDHLMQTLRLEFGRFYFLNDRELLSIIALDCKLITDEHSEENRRILCKMFNNSICGFVLQTLVRPSEKSLRGECDRVFVIGIKSPFKEIIYLSNEEPIPIKKEVNIYSIEVVRILNEITRKLRRTLRKMIVERINNDEEEEEEATQLMSVDWSLPLQLMNLYESVKFCRLVEKSLTNKRSFKSLIELYETRLREFGQHSVQSSAGTITQTKFGASNLDKNQDDDWLKELKHSAAISATVSFISTLTMLQSNNVENVTDWHWEKQVRYYLIPIENCEKEQDRSELETKHHIEVRISNAKFIYKFDYLPLQAINSSSREPTFKRLINTSMTERCLLVASQAVANFKLGASPFGPAGGGKTETIKALGNMIGCQVLVHNCDDTNDSESLDRLIWGLARTGLWGCFDEFNRLAAPVLSSVAATLELVQTSIRENKCMVEQQQPVTMMNQELEGRSQMMSIDKDCAFFVTLNPGGNETKYKGRRQLPTNLRSLFLPVAMVRTELSSIISEHLLTMNNTNTSVGLKSSMNMEASEAMHIGQFLSNWLDSMRCTKIGFGRCEWDLRLVLAILERLNSQRATGFTPSATAYLTHLDADSKYTTMIAHLSNSVKRELKPRFTAKEMVIICNSFTEHTGSFLHKIGRTFNDESKNVADLQGRRQLELQARIKSVISERGLECETSYRIEELAIQLHEQLETRTGVLLLGPQSSGKSSTWRTLSLAQSESIKWVALNPRACNKSSLFGWTNKSTARSSIQIPHASWIDGLLTGRVREALCLLQQEELNVRQVWLVFDGPIDPDWIESLNSVLDDNKVLTLGSGERLDFSPSANKSIKLIFEAADIEYASPATISRLGLVYHEFQYERPRFRFAEMIDKNENCLKVSSDEEAQELIGLFVNHQEAKLLIVEQSSNSAKASSLIKQMNAHKMGDKQQNRSAVYQYVCNQLSSSDDLIELMSCKRDARVFVLVNVHLIKSDIEWSSKSLVELLLFTIEYGGFYQFQSQVSSTSTSSSTFVASNSKFLLLTNSSDQLDAKLLSRADGVIKMPLDGDDDNEAANMTTTKTESLTPELCKTFLEDDENCPILTLSSNSFGSGRRNSISKALEISTVHSFSNSKLAQQSLESLEKVLNGRGLIGIEQSNNSGAQDEELASRFSVYILDEVELELLSINFRKRLLHLLNWFKWHQNLFVRFIFLTHNIELDKHSHTFWSSIGKVIRFDENLVNRTGMDVFGDSLKAELELICVSLGISEPNNSVEFQVAWLVDRFSQFSSTFPTITGEFFREKRKLRAYCKLLIELVRDSRENLFSQKQTFEMCLSRLGEFEVNVKKINSRCRLEEEKLIGSKQAIGQLMKTIDTDLNKVGIQRDQLEDLKRKQVDKKEEIEIRSHKVELELSEILPRIESSKLEVSQFLKPEAMNEIKCLRSPPKVINDILNVLFILLEVDFGNASDDCDTQSNNSWASMRAYLTKNSLRDALTGYNFKRLADKPDLIRKVELAMANKRDSFRPDQASRASKAIVPILGWIQATLEYGRILISLRPLNEQMERLKGEANDIEQKAIHIEEQLTTIDLKIERDSQRLAELKNDFERSQQALNEVKFRLESAQRALIELQNPINRWRLKLKSIEYLLEQTNGELIELCFVAVTTLFMSNQSLSSPSHEDVKSAQPLRDWLKLVCCCGEVKRRQTNNNETECEFNLMAVKIINLINPKLELEIGMLKPDDLDSLLQLSLIKLGLNIENMISFIEINEQISDFELMELLSFGKNNPKVLCERKEMVLVRCNDLDSAEWTNSLELALRLNRLLLVRLSNDSSQLDLDIMDLALRRLAHTKSGIVLLGQLNKHAAIKHLVFPVSSFAGKSNSLQEIEANILTQLISIHEPTLSESIEQLESQLQTKRSESNSLETNLLKRLATNSPSNEQKESFENKDDMLDADLITILGDLRKLGEDLKCDVCNLETKLNELRERQAKYLPMAKEGAHFYLNHLAPLGDVDPFYRVSLDRYTILISSTSTKQQQAAHELGINYEQIKRVAMQPMRPEFKQIFLDRLSADSTLDEKSIACSKPDSDEENSQLEQALLDFMGVEEQLEFDETKCRLMIIVHDASKSSPQLEIDEFLGRKDDARSSSSLGSLWPQTYRKLYATGDLAANRLEAALFDIKRLIQGTSGPGCVSTSHLADAVVKSSDEKRETYHANIAYEKRKSVAREKEEKSCKDAMTQKSYCLCVANAHLSIGWINTRLLKLLDSLRGSFGESGQTVLVVLVCEAAGMATTTSTIATPQVAATGFDSSVLDFARVKYWHEGSTLSLCERFNLFARSCSSALLLRPPTNSGLRASNRLLSSDGRRTELARQLVLLHTVCQERTFTKSRKGVGWERNSYTFDYEQLSLALGTLRRLWSESLDVLCMDGADSVVSSSKNEPGEAQLRARLCRHLESVVYGPRLETIADEQTLAQLVGRFLGSAESGDLQMAKLERLAKLDRANVSHSQQQQQQHRALGSMKTQASEEQYERLLAELIGLTESS